MTPPTTPTWLDEIPQRLTALDHAHLRRTRRVVEPQRNADGSLRGGVHLRVDGEPVLAFCTNDYLGLAQHPTLVQAARDGAQDYGVGATGSPLVSGHSTSNAALECELAAFVGLPRALYFYAGFSTNAGIIPALMGADDAIFSDRLNHACLIDGARLSGAKVHRYPHADLAGLERQLSASPARRKLVLSDAVFSMDGDCANIPGLLTLCERFDALLLLDDAHGFGVRGPQGRGSLAQAGLVGAHASRRILYMATLGKAAGVAGAFVAGDNALVEWLLQKTRSYIFATAAPAMLASTLRASLHVIEHEEWRRTHLQALITRLRTALAAVLQGSHWRLTDSHTAIQALVIGRNDEALAAMDALQVQGLWVPAIRPPTVPDGTARLRIALSAAHSTEDVDRLVAVLGSLAHVVR
jgi:8-amino-7-oxononanoate synthase